MKALKLLKTLLTFLFAICIITIFFGVPFILVLAVMPGQVPFAINGRPATQLGIETIPIIIAFVIGFSFLTYALYLLRKLLALFEKKKIFHDDVIINLIRIGYSILIGCIHSSLTLLLYTDIIKGSSVVIFIIYSASSICLGLFFIVLSGVFGLAKKSEEEDKV
jgi:hypothetical protein